MITHDDTTAFLLLEFWRIVQYRTPAIVGIPYLFLELGTG
jgi:hypothetical protein